MAVTIKEIAEKSGVSRGTVDRVLNHRGNVSEETEKIITKVAEELGYRPNIAGKALAARKKKFNIGVILCSDGNEFFDDVLQGIHRAEAEATDYGVSVLLRTTKGYDVEKQLRLIKELEPCIHFLILNAIHDNRIIKKISELVEGGIQVITVNTDVEFGKRLCHVGADYRKSGETAGGMMGLLTNGDAKVLITTGYKSVLAHNQRIEGFTKIIKERYPKIQVVDVVETEDDKETAYNNTKNSLQKHPDITAIYIVAAGAVGVCLAIEECKREDILVIACDCTKSMEKLIEKGIVKATICQQPFTQGYKSLQIAVQYLVNGTDPYKDVYAMKNEIKIYENM